MPRNWLPGDPEAKAESEKGVQVFKKNRDTRKARTIQMYAEGMSIDEIAKKLKVSTRSVKRYLGLSN